MGHMVNHSITLRTYAIQDGGHDFKSDLVRMEAVIVPYHHTILVEQVFENLLCITFNSINLFYKITNPYV